MDNKVNHQNRSRKLLDSLWKIISALDTANIIQLVALIISTGVTLAMLWILKGTLDATRESVIAARSSAETARNELELSQRPWIRATPALASGWNGGWWPSPFWNVSITVSISNVGHTPAKHVAIGVALLSDDDDVRAFQTTLCEGLQRPNTVGRDGDYTVFPSETLPGPGQGVFPLSIKKDRIEAAKRNREGILPVIVGCVDYEFSFTQGHHQTPFMFTLYYRNALDLEPWKDYAQSDLSLDAYAISGDQPSGAPN